MKERRYMEDYANETRLDERGREKRVAVYRGAWYAGSGLRKAALWALGCWVLAAAAVLVYFLCDFPGGRVLYVFLPVGLSLFALLYWALGVWGSLCAPARMTRLQKEKGPGRVLRSAAACTVLLGAALIGELVYLSAGGQADREWPGAALLLAAFGGALSTVLRLRSRVNEMKGEQP